MCWQGWKQRKTLQNQVLFFIMSMRGSCRKMKINSNCSIWEWLPNPGEHQKAGCFWWILLFLTQAILLHAHEGIPEQRPWSLSTYKRRTDLGTLELLSDPSVTWMTQEEIFLKLVKNSIIFQDQRAFGSLSQMLKITIFLHVSTWLMRMIQKEPFWQFSSNHNSASRIHKIKVHHI